MQQALWQREQLSYTSDTLITLPQRNSTMNTTAHIVHALVAGQTVDTSADLSPVERSALHDLLALLQKEPRDLSQELATINGWTIGAQEHND
jgi:hypothetical protein